MFWSTSAAPHAPPGPAAHHALSSLPTEYGRVSTPSRSSRAVSCTYPLGRIRNEKHHRKEILRPCPPQGFVLVAAGESPPGTASASWRGGPLHVGCEHGLCLVPAGRATLVLP